MDLNKPVTLPTPQPPAPVQPPVPTTPPPSQPPVPTVPQPISEVAKVATVNTATSIHGSLIIGTIVLILTISGGLAFFVLNMKSTNQAAVITPSPTVVAPRPTVTTPPAVLSADEQELRDIVLNEDDVAFKEINFDIKSL